MKKISVLLFLLMYCLLADSQTISNADNQIVEKIRQTNTKHTAVRSKFRQTKHISVLGKDIVSSGMFYYEKPDKLAMRYENPSGDLLLINGDQFVMIAKGKRSEASAKSNAKMRSMKTILSACLQGDVKQTGAYKISCKEMSSFYIITAEIDSKTNKSSICRLILHFDKTDLTLSVLRTEETDGSYTIYELTNKEFDKSIDDSLFLATKK
ncbi:MAG: outer membrane lipoprotein carrier protein LolA [Bacteroidales bacterium]|jgi:outer membrane lipoprotein-sorting protein|nr:outer membrane lipoprotein carrier protein LolA [Bacteroidales bacterium]